jgi:spermidine synthase
MTTLQSKPKALPAVAVAIPAAVLVIFFISGTSALIDQIVWTRALYRIFGVTSLAASTVLAAFMGGLAIGSYLFGRLIDRRGNA